MQKKNNIRKYSSNRRKKLPPHPALDLFGEVPVTLDEVLTWCEVVARIPRDSWRLPWYIKNWDVPGKIKAAKLRGDFQAIISGAGL